MEVVCDDYGPAAEEGPLKTVSSIAKACPNTPTVVVERVHQLESGSQPNDFHTLVAENRALVTAVSIAPDVYCYYYTENEL